MVGGLIRRLATSWTSTKTTDTIVNTQTTEQETDHHVLPASANKTMSAASYTAMHAGDDFCSTY